MNERWPVGEIQYIPVRLDLVKAASVTGLDVTPCTFVKGTDASDEYTVFIYSLVMFQKTAP
jgi:hypothetical protein